jgi:hypothetical protein
MLLLFSIAMIFLVLAAQFESFRSPLIILLGSVPLALTGALLMPYWADDNQHLLTSGSGHARGLSRERHPDRGVRQQLQRGRGLNKFDVVEERRPSACGRF